MLIPRPRGSYPTAIVLANLFLENMEVLNIIGVAPNHPYLMGFSVKKIIQLLGYPHLWKPPTCPIRGFPLAKKIGFRSKPGASPLWQSEWSHNQKASGVGVHGRKHEKLGHLFLKMGSFRFQ
jgi:hypothetical protein